MEHQSEWADAEWFIIMLQWMDFHEQMFACHHTTQPRTAILARMDAPMEACVQLLLHASSMGVFPDFDVDSGKERNRCGGREVQSATRRELLLEKPTMTVQIKVWTALLACKRAVVGGPVCGFVSSAVVLEHRYYSYFCLYQKLSIVKFCRLPCDWSMLTSNVSWPLADWREFYPMPLNPAALTILYA